MSKWDYDAIKNATALDSATLNKFRELFNWELVSMAHDGNQFHYVFKHYLVNKEPEVQGSDTRAGDSSK